MMNVTFSSPLNDNMAYLRNAAFPGALFSTHMGSLRDNCATLFLREMCFKSKMDQFPASWSGKHANKHQIGTPTTCGGVVHF